MFSFDNNYFYDERVYFLCCVIITGIITFFFKVPDKNVDLFKNGFKGIDINNYNFVLIILIFILIFIFDGMFGSILQYIFKNLLFISPIIVASILYLNSTKKTFPNIIFLIVFYYYTSFTFNRTGFLLVPIFFFLTIIVDKNFQFRFKENFSIIFFSIVLLFILLIVGDLYKTSQTRNLLDFIIEFKFNDLLNYFQFTRYKFGSSENIYEYFSIIQVLTDDNKELGGTIFSQFLSIITPRFFFPNKIITNISELNTIQGIVENPLFFGIFIESTYNLGLIGVFFYHFFVLLIGRVMFRSVTATTNKFLFQIFITNYYFYIIYLYILIRGPGIHFASHFLACFLFMCYYLYRVKMKAQNGMKN